MMKRILIILLSCASLVVSGQGTRAPSGDLSRNSLQLSFGGAGVYASIIYERLLTVGPSWNAGVRIGIGTTVSPVFSPPEISMPLGGYLLYGKGNSKLDLGLSLTGYVMWQYDNETVSSHAEIRPLIVPSVAYRFQKPQGGFIFRAGLSSIIHVNSITSSYAPWIDLGVGYGF